MADITVSDFAGLRNAVTDSSSTVIYLDSDITFALGGIIIPRTKGDIVIDGQGHKITDYNSAATGDTLRFNTATNTNPITITLRNLVWSGRNIYGVVYVPSSASNAYTTVALENVNYTGLQAIYNRYGITRFKDSTFTINQNGTTSAINELGEFNRLYIAGTVTVTSYVPSGNIISIMWFPFSGSALVVEPDAKFNVTSVNNYIFYSDTEPDVILGENSVTTINSALGLWYYDATTLHMFSSFNLKSGASFIANTGRASNSYAVFRCRNNFTLDEGSTFHLITQASGSGASLYFPEVATLTFNDPKSVIVYNNGGNVFSFGGGTTANPNKLIATTQQINMWTSAAPLAQAGTFENMPTQRVAKADYSDITTTISASRTATTAITTNVEDGDTGYPMTQATFNIVTAKVFSMGNMGLTLDEVSNISTVITGTTEPAANLIAEFNTTTLTGVADSTGAIDLDIPSSIAPDTEINFGANWKFLYRYDLITVIGEVIISYLPDLEFKTFVAPAHQSIIKRKNPDWYMTVTDYRTSSGPDWYLYAALTSPMYYDVFELDNVLVIKENSTTRTMAPTPILIKQQSWTNNPPIVTTITWTELEGFLLQIDPDFHYNQGLYSSKIDWILRLSPIE